MKHTKYKLTFLSALFVLLLSLLIVPSVVNAASFSTEAEIDVSGSCNGTINGSSSITVNVPSGSDVNVTIENDNPVVSQSVSGPGVSGGTVLNNSNRGSTGFSATFIPGVVTSQERLIFTPIPINYTDAVFVNPCPIGATPTSSTLILNPIAAAPPVTTTTPKNTDKITTPETTTPTPTTTPTTTPATSPSTTPTTATAPSTKTVQAKAAVIATPKLKKARFGSYEVGAGIGIIILLLLVAGCLAGFIPYKKIWTKKRKKSKRSKKKTGKKK